MRIGVFFSAPYYVRGLESALLALTARGHRLVLLGRGEGAPVEVPVSLEATRRVKAATFGRHQSSEHERALLLLRTIRDTARFQNGALAGAHANRTRAALRLSRLLCGDERWTEAIARAKLEESQRIALDSVLGRLEALVPVDQGIVDAMCAERLDLALVISRVNIGGGQDEVVRAASVAGVPSALVLYSWDNLTNKGLLHAHPDRLLVWNETQRREAVDLHGILPEAVAVVGAPRFDSFFELRPSADRETIHLRFGLDPGKPTVLYLGSSTFVAPREPEFVERWLDSVRAHGDLADVNVIVRPHPGTLKHGTSWNEWRPPDDRRTVVVRGDRRLGGQDLYDQLSACDVVVGLNTSAEIEAAIVGRPVLTVRAGDLAPGQEGSTHYGYLLAEHGGPVTEAATLEEHVRQLVAALERDPTASSAREDFVARFVRPGGIGRPAGDALAHEVDSLYRATRSGFGRRLRARVLRG